VCDAVETCTGTVRVVCCRPVHPHARVRVPPPLALTSRTQSATCPIDAFMPTSVQCRAATDLCVLHTLSCMCVCTNSSRAHMACAQVRHRSALSRQCGTCQRVTCRVAHITHAPRPRVQPTRSRVRLSCVATRRRWFATAYRCVDGVTRCVLCVRCARALCYVCCLAVIPPPPTQNCTGSSAACPIDAPAPLGTPVRACVCYVWCDSTGCAWTNLRHSATTTTRARRTRRVSASTVATAHVTRAHVRATWTAPMATRAPVALGCVARDHASIANTFDRDHLHSSTLCDQRDHGHHVLRVHGRQRRHDVSRVGGRVRRRRSGACVNVLCMHASVYVRVRTLIIHPQCDGSSVNCPVDSYAPSSVTCGTATGCVHRVCVCARVSLTHHAVRATRRQRAQANQSTAQPTRTKRCVVRACGGCVRGDRTVQHV
jgi:hypothetical protein